MDCESAIQAMADMPEGSDSSSDGDTVIDSNTGVTGVMKRWSWKANEAYFVNILIRSCVEIIESGNYMSLPQIEAQLMDVWHRRLFTLSRTLTLFAFDLTRIFPSLGTSIPYYTPSLKVSCIHPSCGNTRLLKIWRSARLFSINR
jgi:hypothetical protein